MDSTSLMMIVIVVVMIGFMWWQSRKQKQRQQQTTDWRTSLAPGEEVATVSGLLGKVKEVDVEHDQIVIDSEGSLSRWRIQAITKPPVVPAYVSDDEVDEKGNPLPKAEGDAETSDASAEEPTDTSVPSENEELSDPADEAKEEAKTATPTDSDASNGPIESEK
ncbi:MAG: preprotein translocase subunit YajC [Bifidobacteriaceae bacterium]|jgi:preprotein translocase subunit YajC|nr:preprotein translocase subunit YajC [Bifidobacteriaceae bacterium]